jgi:cytoskeletal protein CcmA (bactofilin family)
MFSNSPKKSGSGSVTLIARNTSIEGKVNFSGFLNVEGHIKGDILAEESSKSEVIVLEHGVVEGQVQAPRVIVNGHVVGDIYASDQLYIAAKAVVEGSVHYRLIEMEKGAQISGNMVHRAGTSKQQKPDSGSSSGGISEVLDSSNGALANT